MRSVKDAAGFTQMKYRQDGQSSVEELKRKDLRAVLEEKERKHFQKTSKEEFLGTLCECTKLPVFSRRLCTKCPSLPISPPPIFRFFYFYFIRTNSRKRG